MSVSRELRRAYLLFFARKYRRFPLPEQFTSESEWLLKVQDVWGIRFDVLMELLTKRHRMGETLTEDPAYFKAHYLADVFLYKTPDDYPTYVLLEGKTFEDDVYEACVGAIRTTRMQKRRAFSHSPGYRSVQLRDQKFRLTLEQAQIIQILHSAWISGTPELSREYLLERLRTPHSRLQDFFRKNMDCYHALIKIGRKGTVALKM